MDKKDVAKFGAKAVGAHCVSTVVVRACKNITGYSNAKPLTKICLWVGSEILGWVIGDICVDKLEEEMCEFKDELGEIKEAFDVGEARS